MSEDYVHKDTFDEALRRIEAMMAASEARQEARQREYEARQREYEARQRESEARQRESEAMHREYMARQDAKIEEIRGDSKVLMEAIAGIKERLDDMAARASFGEKLFAVMGILGTLSAVILAGVQVYLALR